MRREVEGGRKQNTSITHYRSEQIKTSETATNRFLVHARVRYMHIG